LSNLSEATNYFGFEVFFSSYEETYISINYVELEAIDD